MSGEMGAFLHKWGASLLANPVPAQAVVLTNFDQRAALQVYPHTLSSLSVLPDCFDLLPRWGIGTNTINRKDAADADKLTRYALALIPAATALDGQAVPRALRPYVERGGYVLITPFTGYQSGSGIFRGHGFGANLASLPPPSWSERAGAWAPPLIRARKNQLVKWSLPGIPAFSPVGVDGYCEFMDVSPGAEVNATFRSNQPLLNGRRAAVRNKLGQGSVIKLAFWPADDSTARLIAKLVPRRGEFVAGAGAGRRASGSALR